MIASFKRLNGIVYARAFHITNGIDSGWQPNIALYGTYQAKLYSGNLFGLYNPSGTSWMCMAYVP